MPSAGPPPLEPESGNGAVLVIALVPALLELGPDGPPSRLLPLPAAAEQPGSAADEAQMTMLRLTQKERQHMALG
jgi:hypothetical protein